MASWFDIRDAGEETACRRAGPWPAAGNLLDYELAAARAHRAACHTGDIGYRYSRRFGLWHRMPDDRAQCQLDRLAARRQMAIDIAEDRRWLLRRLLHDEPAGAA